MRDLFRGVLPMLRRIVLSCLVLFAGAAGAADAPLEKLVTLYATATIGADGHVTALAWDGDSALHKSIAARLEPRVRTWEFEPGTADGVAAETRTGLSITLRATPAADGSLALQFHSASTGPKLVTMVMPGYPSGALRENKSAYVRTEFAINTDGTTTVLDVDVQASHRKAQEFEQAARSAFARWKYEPEVVGGHPVATRMVIPSRFCSSDSDWCEKRTAQGPLWSKPMPTSQDGQPVALDSAVKLKTQISGEAI
jgi:TonB family protein